MNEITEEIVKEWGRKAMSYFSGTGIEFFVLIAFCAPFNFVYLPWASPFFVRKIYNRKHDRKKSAAAAAERPARARPRLFRSERQSVSVTQKTALNQTASANKVSEDPLIKKPPAKAGGLKTCNKKNSFRMMFRRPGSDLLSRALRQSTMGAKGFNVRVRNGIGWDTFAITTRSSKHHLKELEPNLWSRLFIR